MKLSYHDITTANKVIQKLDEVNLPRVDALFLVIPFVASFFSAYGPGDSDIFLGEPIVLWVCG